VNGCHLTRRSTGDECGLANGGAVGKEAQAETGAECAGDSFSEHRWHPFCLHPRMSSSGSPRSTVRSTNWNWRKTRFFSRLLRRCHLAITSHQDSTSFEFLFKKHKFEETLGHITTMMSGMVCTTPSPAKEGSSVALTSAWLQAVLH